MKAAFFDCLQFCCGKPETCDRVCRNHPDYVNRVREVGRFALDNVPRGPLLDAPELPRLMPVIYGNRRALAVPFSVAALPLYRMFRRRTGELRFGTHGELCEEFGLVPGTPIVLTGTDPAFSSGVDLKEVLSGEPYQPPRTNPGQALRAMTTPVICAVNGSCVSGGLEVALSCSFIIASDRARFITGQILYVDGGRVLV